MSAGRDMEIALAKVGLCPANGWSITHNIDNSGGHVEIRHAERGLSFLAVSDIESTSWAVGETLSEQVKDLIVLHFAKGNVK